MTTGELREETVNPDPFEQFRLWFEEAQTANLPKPESMTLATATRDGIPSARIVLLRGFDKRGFVFFTNYNSRKGRELDDNPHAALVFHWNEMDRQVRIEGRVERVSAEESDAYFASRPWGHRIGALVSPQSQMIPNREFLDQRMQEMAENYRLHPVPRPAHWGGYRVLAECIEFWQGQGNRLHDRLRFRFRESGEWAMDRLAP